ncbi:MAG: hypothetical protein Q4G45_02955 [Actinomycetia bacterium]|nr:hypothetical protein [Actinomycetes bacterium]
MTVPAAPRGQPGSGHPRTCSKILVHLLTVLAGITCGPVIGGGYQHLELWLGGAISLVILVFVPALLQRPQLALLFALLAASVCLVSSLIHLLTASPAMTTPVAALVGVEVLALALALVLALIARQH